MKIEITKINTIKNIFKNKLYLLILLGSIVVAVLLPVTAQKIVVPAFYKQMITNTLDDAKKVGTHIARHQNTDISSTVFYTAIDKLKDDFYIVKIRLFDKNGKIIFSTKTSEIGNINEKDYFFNIVAKGKMFYKVVKKGSNTAEGGKLIRDVVEIYVPIMKDSMFMGSSEIYYDITDKKESFAEIMEKVNSIYYLFSIFFIVLSLIVIYVLSKNNLKELNTEDDLKEKVDQKTKELKEINKHLENRISEEVQKNRFKDTQIFEQSKLASMGEMIGNIAHQWRQPLSAITSSASALKLSNELGIIDDNEIDNKMDGIIAKANFLSNTIENFRNFFKKDNQVVEFNLVETIKKAESIIDSNFKNENIKLIYDFDSESVIIKSLEGELSQAIINILNNSYDNFIEKNIQNRVVKISLTTSNDIISIKINDNGGGIPKDIMSKIFEPYFTTKHQSQGTGIGLYMCSEIIKKHLNGDIKVSNEEIELDEKKYLGACFNILFKSNI